MSPKDSIPINEKSMAELLPFIYPYVFDPKIYWFYATKCHWISFIQDNHQRSYSIPEDADFYFVITEQNKLEVWSEAQFSNETHRNRHQQ